VNKVGGKGSWMESGKQRRRRARSAGDGKKGKGVEDAEGPASNENCNNKKPLKTSGRLEHGKKEVGRAKKKNGLLMRDFLVTRCGGREKTAPKDERRV